MDEGTKEQMKGASLMLITNMETENEWFEYGTERSVSLSVSVLGWNWFTLTAPRTKKSKLYRNCKRRTKRRLETRSCDVM